MKREVKKCLSVLLIAAISVAVISCGKKKEETTAAPKLESKYIKLEKVKFTTDENVNCTYTVPESARESGWIGIIPSRIQHGSEEVNDDNDLVFHLLKGETTGTYSFAAPKMPGEYDLRMNDSDSNGKEIDTISFTVELPAGQQASTQPLTPPTKLESKYMKIEKVQFAPNENINVKFTVPASARKSGWAGIVPSRIEHGSEKTNDDNDIVFHLLKGKTTDTYTFSAPNVAGAYDIRMNDDDSGGKEIDSLSFIVVMPGQK